MKQSMVNKIMTTIGIAVGSVLIAVIIWAAFCVIAVVG